MAGIVKYQGQRYELRDPYTEWTRVEAKFIKDKTGLRLGEIAGSSVLFDPDAICAMLYIARKRAGEKVKWSDFDDFTMAEIEWVLDDEAEDGDGADGDSDSGEGGADPTETGTTQTKGSTPTSRRSRSGSTSPRAKSTS